MDRFPKQSGTMAEPTLSREVSRVLDRADEEAKALGDAYVSTEHLLLALLEEKGTTAKQLLSAAGVDRNDLMAALQGVRGTHRVTDQERSEEHTSELQSLAYLVCRLLLEKKKKKSGRRRSLDLSVH